MGMRVGKPRVEENEKTKWEVSSRCFSFLELIASNILSSRFHFFLELITWSMGDKIITLSKRRTSSVYISVQH